MGRRRRGRDVNGVIVLDKPRGMSSNEAVQRVKRLFAARKVGHTGSLDPLATGVLPLCLGDATKFSQYLLTSDKTYVATLRLGVSTDSGDADGTVLKEREVGAVSRARIDAALEGFRGEIEQVPSMFSAVKHQGKPLYKLARQGIEIEREARPVTIYRNEIVDYADDRLVLEVHCSKGTYVRTIAHDLGEMLGCGAHVEALRRTTAGPYRENDLVTFDEMSRMAELGKLDSLLQPVATAVGQWPPVELAGAPAFYLKQGQPVLVPHAPTQGWVRLYEQENDDGRFIGVGEILNDGRVAPRRLIV
ncbi:MAG: tRNA pseudouridine(55) synthase TruB [Gammaproteobacteria bacterium]|nr:tRNA pseudouridine(55) synthase TruB [Gammaproteobacteria bacterium]